MHPSYRPHFIVIWSASTAVVLLLASGVWAQSGTRRVPTTRPGVPLTGGSSTRQMEGSASRPSSAVAASSTPEIALDGMCSVCLVEMKQAVPGQQEFASVYDGKTYLFPGAEQKRMFDANPAKYAPALGGDCTVCKVEKSVVMPGKPEFFSMVNERLFVFPGAQQKQMFDANPEKYASADVAMEGYCPVCLVEMRKLVPGSAQFAADFNGKRYLFPGAEQRDMFLSNPGKYVPTLDANCVVCQVEMQQETPGNPQFGATYRNRLFLFPDAQMRQMFMENPVKYVNADVALNGYCPVCRVEMGQNVRGRQNITAVHDGKRYLFPSDQQRDMFLANPARYVSE